MHDLKKFFCDKIYLYRSSAYGIIRRCVPEVDMLSVLEECHSSLVGWAPLRYPNGAFDLVMLVLLANHSPSCSWFCQIMWLVPLNWWNFIEARVPLESNSGIDLFVVWGIEFMRPIVSFKWWNTLYWLSIICWNLWKQLYSRIIKRKVPPHSLTIISSLYLLHLVTLLVMAARTFINELFKGMLKKYGVRHNVATSYHP